jgi:hypothetical protein
MSTLVRKKELSMAHRFRPGLLLPLTAIGLAAILGGCVAYPAYPAYGAGYGYSQPYYSGGYVGFGGGGGWHERGGHEGWHDHDDGWRR